MYLQLALEVPGVGFPWQLILSMDKRNDKNKFFFVSSLGLLRTETHSILLPNHWWILLMFCMQCPWITNHFDSFIPRFWRIRFSSTNSPCVNRLPPWILSIRLSTSLSIRCSPWGLFFRHNTIRCPQLTPHKLPPLGPQVNTPIDNPLFRFLAVLAHLEALSGIGSLEKTLIPRYLLIEQRNYPMASFFLSGSKPNIVLAN